MNNLVDSRGNPLGSSNEVAPGLRGYAPSVLVMPLQEGEPSTTSEWNRRHAKREAIAACNALGLKYMGGYGEDAIMYARLGIPAVMGGAASAWAFTNGGRTKLLDGTFDIDSDSWKIALFLSTSNIGATSTTYAGLTNEHANANGYTTGGIAVTLTLAGTTTVTVSYSTSIVWTASGGSIVARFGVIYEVSGNVLCYCTLDSTPADVTATDGNTLSIVANASGVFTLA